MFREKEERKGRWEERKRRGRNERRYSSVPGRGRKGRQKSVNGKERKKERKKKDRAKILFYF